MTKFAHTRVALGLLVVVGMAALAGCQPGVPDTVKIGVAQPLTGPLKELGQDMVDGTQMAIDDINKEGLKVDGKLVKLEIVTADDKADAEAGKAAAQKLIDAGVVAVIGHLNSGVSIAARDVYGAKMVPQLAISTKPEYITESKVPTTFRLVASDALQSKAMGSIANGLPGEHVYAVVDDNTPYGKSLAENAQAQLKGKTIGVRASLDDKTTDFKALVAQLLEKKVDVFVTTLADFQVVALAEQLVAAGVKNMNIIGSDTIKTEGMLKVNASVGTIYATSPIIGAGEFTGGKPFLEKFRARFKHDPIYAAHYAYDAVYVLAAAIKQAKSVDGNKLVPALKTVDALAPVTSSMRFAENGEQRYGSVSVYQLNRGNWFLLTRSDVW
jgi:branched-chain amino acid transport system substrate-binding protein